MTAIAMEADNPSNVFARVREFARSLIRHHEMDGQNAKTLEEHIAEITSKREKIKLPREHFYKFCDAVNETNPLHFNPEFAKAQGLDDVIAPGMQLAALGEQYINEILIGINQIVGVPYLPASIEVGFGKHFVYPETKLLWVCYDYDIQGDNGAIKLSLVGGERSNLRQIDLDKPEITKADRRIIKKLGTTIEVLLQKEHSTEDKHLYGADHKQNYALDKRSLFLESLDENPTEFNNIPLMYPASFFTATILDYFKSQPGGASGIHVGSDFTFYANPIPETDLVVELFFLKESKRMVDAVGSQNHKPSIYAETRFLPVDKRSLLFAS
ncbi:MAG: MaoC family dehydratase [Nanoarchaeota archaeon]